MNADEAWRRYFWSDDPKPPYLSRHLTNAETEQFFKAAWSAGYQQAKDEDRALIAWGISLSKADQQTNGGTKPMNDRRTRGDGAP